MCLFNWLCPTQAKEATLSKYITDIRGSEIIPIAVSVAHRRSMIGMKNEWWFRERKKVWSIFIFIATLVFSKSKNYTRDFSLDEESKRSILKMKQKRLWIQYCTWKHLVWTQPHVQDKPSRQGVWFSTCQHELAHKNPHPPDFPCNFGPVVPGTKLYTILRKNSLLLTGCAITVRTDSRNERSMFCRNIA